MEDPQHRPTYVRAFNASKSQSGEAKLAIAQTAFSTALSSVLPSRSISSTSAFQSGLSMTNSQTISTTPTSTACQTDECSSGDNSSSHVGAIVGGTVGGDIAITIISGFIWMMLRRKRTGRSAPNNNNQTYQRRLVELDGKGKPKGLHELSNLHGISELEPGASRSSQHELQGRSVRSEFE